MFKQLKDNKGFTLIELLVVLAIIGILAAVAIPQFSKYRQNAFNAAAQSDIRNSQTALEGSYAENLRYPAALSSAFAFSAKVLNAYTAPGVGDDYGIGAAHQRGTKIYAGGSKVSGIWQAVAGSGTSVVTMTGSSGAITAVAIASVPASGGAMNNFLKL